MGRPKESLPLGDSTMLGRAVDTLLQVTDPVVVVARDEQQELPPLPVEIELAYDESPDLGPLAGIAAGMRRLGRECDAAFVTGCDMPYLHGGVVQWLSGLLGGHDLAIPQVDGVLQPLCALYRLRLLGRIELLLHTGERSPKALIPRCDARIVTEAEVDAFDPTRRFLRSIDTREDYEAVRQA
jgi:molybdopterin-guanine dinucleotide biosynthesis protein A